MGWRHVQPRFADGRLVPNEAGCTVSFSPSGLLIFLHVDGSEGRGGIAISRFAWNGIVAAVAELQAEAKEQAKQDVTVDALLSDDDE